MMPAQPVKQQSIKCQGKPAPHNPMDRVNIFHDHELKTKTKEKEIFQRY